MLMCMHVAKLIKNVRDYTIGPYSMFITVRDKCMLIHTMVIVHCKRSTSLYNAYICNCQYM